MGIIAYHRNLFHCGRYAYSPSDIGVLMVQAAMSGTEHTTFGGGGVAKINYLEGMLRHTARTGEFFDAYDPLISSHDHDFDPNQPTPGVFWGRVQKLRAEAREARRKARELRGADGARSLVLMYEEIADRLLEASTEFDSSKQGRRPLRKAFTVPQARWRFNWVPNNCFWWDGRVFNFGGWYASPQLLGRMISATLLRGEEWVRFGKIELTVNYLLTMCREVGRHGIFDDNTYIPEFDANVAPDMEFDHR